MGSGGLRRMAPKTRLPRGGGVALEAHAANMEIFAQLFENVGDSMSANAKLVRKIKMRSGRCGRERMARLGYSRF